MKLSGADRRVAAAIMAAGAAMALCFVWRSTMTSSLHVIPREPAEAVEAVETAGIDLVDVNTAGLEELMSLPGIGEAKAEAILSWREEQGPFEKPEDIMRIPGIKEAAYAKLRDKITVRD